MDGAPRPVITGDLIRFDVGITTIPGSVPDLRIVELLSPSLSLISATVVSTGTGLTIRIPSGPPSSLDFGTVLDLSDGTNPGAERFTIEYVTRAVSSDPSARFAATLSAATPSGPGWSTAATDTLPITSPALTLQAAAPAFAQAGQVVTITITLANASGAANAYGLTLANTVPPGLTPVPSSLNAAGTRAAAIVTPTGLSLSELDAGETLTVTYRTQFALGAGQTAVAPSVALIATTRSDFALPPQTASAPLALTQPVLSVSASQAQYRVGDVAAFQFTVALPAGSSPALRLLDTLPTGFSYLPGSVAVLDGSGAAGALTPAVSVTGQAVTLDSGAVTASSTRQILRGLRASVTGLTPLGSAINSASVSTRYAGIATAAAAVITANTAPVLASIVPVTTIADTQTTAPFASVQVTDPDLAGQQLQTLTVTLDHPGNGTLTSLGAGTYDPVSSIYRLTGTP